MSSLDVRRWRYHDHTSCKLHVSMLETRRMPRRNLNPEISRSRSMETRAMTKVGPEQAE